jgi:tRNA pseudouridine38-40 synthase
MIALAPLFEGEHDFSAFAASDDRDALGGSKVRTIFASCLHDPGDRLVYRVTGSGFLKHMVRNIVGTLLEAGKGNVTREDILEAFQTPVSKAGPTAPASGLLLVSVEY